MGVCAHAPTNKIKITTKVNLIFINVFIYFSFFGYVLHVNDRTDKFTVMNPIILPRFNFREGKISTLDV